MISYQSRFELPHILYPVIICKFDNAPANLYTYVELIGLRIPKSQGTYFKHYDNVVNLFYISRSFINSYLARYYQFIISPDEMISTGLYPACLNITIAYIVPIISVTFIHVIPYSREKELPNNYIHFLRENWRHYLK